MARIDLSKWEGTVDGVLKAIHLAGGNATPVDRAVANALRVARAEGDGIAELVLESYLALRAKGDREGAAVRLGAVLVNHWMNDRDMVSASAN